MVLTGILPAITQRFSLYFLNVKCLLILAGGEQECSEANEDSAEEASPDRGKEKVHLQSEHSKAIRQEASLSLLQELQRHNKTLKVSWFLFLFFRDRLS